MKLNGLEQYFETNKNGEIVDFKQFNSRDMSPLMYAFVWNKSKQLNLSTEQFNYLIENSELKNMNKYRETPLMCALRYNEEENLNLNSEQWGYLIQNSDLKQRDENGWSPLMDVLRFNKHKKMNLTKKQWDDLIDNSELSFLNKEELIELKKIQSELSNVEIIAKIDIKKGINKKVKI